MKPEATAVGEPQDGRWKITLMFDGRRFWIPKFRYSTLQQMTRQWRHRWFPTTSCFGVTNHSEASSWLVRQDRATINWAVRHLAAHHFCSDRWLQRPRWVGWLVRYLDIYLFYVYGLDVWPTLVEHYRRPRDLWRKATPEAPWRLPSAARHTPESDLCSCPASPGCCTAPARRHISASSTYTAAWHLLRFSHYDTIRFTIFKNVV